jgi:hypothetical protein
MPLLVQEIVELAVQTDMFMLAVQLGEGRGQGTERQTYRGIDRQTARLAFR